MSSLPRDNNYIPVAGGQYNDGSGTIAPLLIDPATGRLLVSAIGAGGTNYWTLNGSNDIFNNNASGNVLINTLGTAVSGTNFNSGAFRLTSSYYTGSAAAQDYWQLQTILGTGNNPSSTLIISHVGSTGQPQIQIPSGTNSSIPALAFSSAPNVGIWYNAGLGSLAILNSGTLVDFRVGFVQFSVYSEFNGSVTATNGLTQSAVLVGHGSGNSYAISLTGSTLQNTTSVATSGANFNSPTTTTQGNYWNGSASAGDTWQWQGVLGAGTNPTSTYTLTHAGSSGAALVQINSALTASGTITGLNLTTTGIVTGSFIATANAGANISLAGSTLTASSNSIYQFAGSSNNNWRVAVASNNTQNVPTNSNYSQFLVGNNPVTYTAGSATVGFVANAVVDTLGTITANGNTITNTASLYVGAAGTGGANNYALYVAGNTAITGQYWSPTVTTTTTLNWNSSNVQYITLASGAQTFIFANPQDGARYILVLQQPASGSAGTVTWPAAVAWAGGTAPTLTVANGKVDLITFVYSGANSKYYAGSNLNY